LAGVIADRVDKRRLLLATQTAMMVLAFVLAWLTWVHRITVWQIVVLAFLNGTAMAINNPSYQALVPKLVPREDLTNAIALNSAQFNMSSILGPTLGGYAMVAFGVAGNFFLNGVSFVAVLLALMRLRFPEEKPERHEGLLDSLISGVSLCAGHSGDVCADVDDRRGELSADSLPHVYSLTLPGISSAWARAGWAWLLAASGTGAVLAAAVVAWKGAMRYRGRIIAFCGAGCDGGRGGVLLFAELCAFRVLHVSGGVQG
jgi:MFS family permease